MHWLLSTCWQEGWNFATKTTACKSIKWLLRYEPLKRVTTAGRPLILRNFRLSTKDYARFARSVIISSMRRSRGITSRSCLREDSASLRHANDRQNCINWNISYYDIKLKYLDIFKIIFKIIFSIILGNSWNYLTWIWTFYQLAILGIIISFFFARFKTQCCVPDL